jgi:uncharacterized iron-regulated membrane protein
MMAVRDADIGPGGYYHGLALVPWGTLYHAAVRSGVMVMMMRRRRTTTTTTTTTGRRRSRMTTTTTTTMLLLLLMMILTAAPGRGHPRDGGLAAARALAAPGDPLLAGAARSPEVPGWDVGVRRIDYLLRRPLSGRYGPE